MKASRLGDFVKIQTGKLDANASKPLGKYPFFTCAETPLQIDEFAYDCECVLVAGNGDLNAKYYSGKFNAYQRTYIMESADARLLDVRYLYHFMTLYVRKLRAMSIGGVIKYIKLDYLTEARVPIPELQEQKRIAAILDKADAIRRKRQEAIKLADEFLRSLFLDMFGDPVRNPKGWPTKELRAVVKTGTIVTYGIVQAGEEFPGGVPYIRTGDIVEGRIRTDSLRHTDPVIAARFDRSRVAVGDIVMSIRATVGTVARVPAELDGANLTQGTARIAPGVSITGRFLFAYLSSSGTQSWIDAQVKGATFREITLARLRELPVYLPPLGLQREFDERIRRLEALVEEFADYSSACNALCSSAQRRAFRGEL